MKTFYEEELSIDPMDLIEPTAVMILGCDMLCEKLHTYDIVSKLIEPEQGYWLPWSKKPFIPHGDYYPIDHIGDRDYVMSTIQEMAACRTPFVNIQNPTQVFDPVKIRKNLHLVTDHQRNNPEALELAHVYIHLYLNRLAPINRNFSTKRLDVQSHLKPEYQIPEVEDRIDEAMDDIYLLLNQFVDKDIWHLYHTRRKGNSIYVEKLIDYRVFDWYRLKKEELGYGDDA